MNFRPCDYEILWLEGGRDLKTLAACTLYEALSMEGIIQGLLGG